jgi:hypothetical protein
VVLGWIAFFKESKKAKVKNKKIAHLNYTLLCNSKIPQKIEELPARSRDDSRRNHSFSVTALK